MKLPWYIKEVKTDSKMDREGHLIVTFKFSKIWIYYQFVKLWIIQLFKIRISWQ